MPKTTLTKYDFSVESMHGNGAEWGGFCLLHPHPLISYTYPLPYLYSTGIRNYITSLSSIGLSIPDSSPSP